MAKCSGCNTLFDGEFCPQCGKRAMQEKRCPQCGAIHSGDVRFCAKCGYAFAEPTPRKQKKQNDGAFLLTMIRIIPAAFMLLFSGLLFLLYTTPVIEDELLFGAVNLRENIYGLMRTEKYGAVAIFVYFAIFLSVFSLLYLLFACLPSRWQKIGKKLYLLDLISYMGGLFYIISLVLVCVLFAKIGSQRVVGEASCQLLMLIFTLVFMVIHVACILSWLIVSRRYEQPTLPASSWYARKNKACVAILSVALALTIGVLALWEFMPKIRYKLGVGSTECGTYYLVENGKTQEDTYITLELENRWEDSMGLSGTYQLDEEGDILMTVISLDEKPIGYAGTLKDDVLTIRYTVMGIEIWERTYVKGKDIKESESTAPPAADWTEHGTYYLIEDGVANQDKYIILEEGNTWQDNGLLRGEYTLDEEGNIQMTAISLEGVSFGYTGTVSGDILKIKYSVAGISVWTRTYVRGVDFSETSSESQDLV